MKLTNHDRAVFVRAVMDDVPQIDYNEQAQAIVEAAALRTLPADVAKLYGNKKLRGFLKTNVYYHTPGELRSVSIPINVTLEPAEDLALEELAEGLGAQNALRAALKDKLLGAIHACSTLNVAKKMLPEFLQYLPQERQPNVADRSMPVVANVVADLVKAGWPKGKS
jgi:hypothetical protein